MTFKLQSNTKKKWNKNPFVLFYPLKGKCKKERIWKKKQEEEKYKSNGKNEETIIIIKKKNTRNYYIFVLGYFINIWKKATTKIIITQNAF